MMKNTGRLLFLAVLAYLLGDFLVFKGPLHRWIAGSDPIVARVSKQPIYRGQLERAVQESLWFQGKSASESDAAELAKLRSEVLNELIDHTILRSLIRAEKVGITVSEAEVDARLQRFSSRFKNQSELDAALKSQDLGKLRDRLRAQLLQEKIITQRIGPWIQVSDDEARRWFVENQATLAQPERVEARHVFIPTLDHPPEEAKKRLDAALLELTEKKKDFATLALEVSEDPATKDIGGSLGWMTRARLPLDFAAPVFDMQPLEPKLIRTKLGWHLVEVTARKSAEPRSFEQAKPEIVAALQAIKRREAVANLRKSLRDSTEGIEIF